MDISFPQPPPGKRTILIVEDDQLFRKAMATYLCSLGFQLVTAESAEAVLAAIADWHVDLIVTDYHLPGMNGIELARSLRARRIMSPMILISGFLSETVHHEAREANIAHILRKPADLAAIEATIVDAFMNVSRETLPN